MVFVTCSPFLPILVISFSIRTEKVMYFLVSSPKQVNLQILLLATQKLLVLFLKKWKIAYQIVLFILEYMEHCSWWNQKNLSTVFKNQPENGYQRIVPVGSAKFMWVELVLLSVEKLVSCHQKLR